MNPFIFVALDGLIANEIKTLRIMNDLSSVTQNIGFKINLDYILSSKFWSTFEVIDGMGRPVFFDLKMWNGTRTMASVVERLVNMNAYCLNVYALADDLIPEVVKITEGSNTKVFGVTVLTHFNEKYCQNHFRRSLNETVRHLADVAVSAGCHGIILPGTALDAVSDMDTIKVVPGIRPTWYKDTRHEEEVSPQFAAQKGADILVCGSPIMKSENPRAALEKILQEIQQ